MPGPPAPTPGGSRGPAGPRPAWRFAVRQLRFWLTDYRRTWRGSIISTVLNPLLYLGAMGLGLGTLVDEHGTARLGGVSYLVFLAPGLLAASAMGTGVGESTYPVFSARSSGTDLPGRGVLAAAAARPVPRAPAVRRAEADHEPCVFLAVAAAFGAIHSPWPSWPCRSAVLTGLAFTAPIEALP